MNIVNFHERGPLREHFVRGILGSWKILEQGQSKETLNIFGGLCICLIGSMDVFFLLEIEEF